MPYFVFEKSVFVKHTTVGAVSYFCNVLSNYVHFAHSRFNDDKGSALVADSLTRGARCKAGQGPSDLLTVLRSLVRCDQQIFFGRNISSGRYKHQSQNFLV